MKRNFGQQKGENNRLQQQITLLKQEKTNLQQNLLCKSSNLVIRVEQLCNDALLT